MRSTSLFRLFLFAAACSGIARATMSTVTMLAALMACAVLPARAADAPAGAAANDWKLDSDTFEGLRARSLGPGTMSGRISCIDGVSGERNTLWVGTAGGGVWRSRDNGTTWKSVFDANAMSIGAIRVSAKDPKLVYVGAGETWTRNSVGYGDGMYRTTDGGKTWEKTVYVDARTGAADLAVD